MFLPIHRKNSLTTADPVGIQGLSTGELRPMAYLYQRDSPARPTASGLFALIFGGSLIPTTMA
jgi:hypothetical protein